MADNYSPLLSSSTYGAWSHMSDEMYSRADAHRWFLNLLIRTWPRGTVNRVWLLFQILGKRFSARSHSGTTAAFRRAHQEEEACMTVCWAVSVDGFVVMTRHQWFLCFPSSTAPLTGPENWWLLTGANNWRSGNSKSDLRGWDQTIEGRGNVLTTTQLFSVNSYLYHLFPLQTGEEEIVWINKRTRSFVQLCWGKQAHLHKEREAKGRVFQPLVR